MTARPRPGGRRPGWITIVLAVAGLGVGARPAAAHCDTTRGPVVEAARAALEAGDVDRVLHWVRGEDAAVIGRAFEQTMAVRGLGPEARALADRYFFETVVRVHRAGEGAAYTGLVDGEPAPIIAAMDQALAAGSADQLEELLVARVRTGLAERYAVARAARGFQPGDVAGGRAYVAAYVPLAHWVEGVFAASTGEAHGEAGGREHRGGAAVELAGHPRPAGQRWPWLLVAGLAAVAILEGGVLWARRERASRA